MFTWRVLALIALLALTSMSVYAWREVTDLRSQLHSALREKNDLERTVSLQERHFLEEQKVLKDRLDSALSHLEKNGAALPEQNSPGIGTAVTDRRDRQSEAQPQTSEERRTIWRARQGVGDVEEVMALSSTEKSLLSERLQQAYLGGSDAQTLQQREAMQAQILTEVLGPERAQQYDNLRKEAQQREFEEGLQKEVIVLSRKLGLSAAQEQEVRQALIQAEQVVLPKRVLVREKMQEAMALHFDGESGKEKLQTQYDEIKTLSDELKLEKDRAVLNAIEGKLSDSQKNELLALQAQSK